MQSKISELIKMKLCPVAIVWSDTKPDDCLQFSENKWGCVMTLFAQAAKGKIAILDAHTFGCNTAGFSFGFGRTFNDFNGGLQCFYHFLSNGNENWEGGREKIEELKGKMRAESMEHFIKGERYIKSPDLVEARANLMPHFKIHSKYVIFKPLHLVDELNDDIKSIVFTVNADQLSALVVLANFARDSADNVYAPFGAGCQSIGMQVYMENISNKPRAIIGLTDPSARLNTKPIIGSEYLTIAVPFSMYEEMESNADLSFLKMHTWQKLMND